MRPVGNALELKLCKIPTIGTQSENQTLPTGNISLGSPIVFSGWALHKTGFWLLCFHCFMAKTYFLKGIENRGVF
ncbi:hypothetical protein HMPREF1428_01566 [Helicobacter pylori GAM83T]|nr:hypothetical protein HMPREF1428_01566 [Helicobacter pylori GAM83T]